MSATPLPDHVKARFRTAFPGVDLDRVRVHDELPWMARFAPIRVRAMALDRHVYFDGGFDPDSPAGLAAIAHELAHVAQWRRTGGFLLGPPLFAARYLGGYFLNRLRGMGKYEAYRNIRFEREAERFERSVTRPTPRGPAPTG